MEGKGMERKRKQQEQEQKKNILSLFLLDWEHLSSCATYYYKIMDKLSSHS